MRSLPHLRSTAAALAAALVLAGCSGGSANEGTTDEATTTAGTSTTTPAATESASATADASDSATAEAGGGDAEAFAQQVGDFMESATSVVMQMDQSSDITSSSGGAPITTTLSFGGPYHIDTTSMDMTTSVTSQGQAQDSRMIVVPEADAFRVYYQGAADGAWAQSPMTADQVASLGLDSGFTQAVDLLSNLSSGSTVTVEDVAASDATGGEAARQATVELGPDDVLNLMNSGGTMAIDSYDGTGTFTMLAAADDGAPISFELALDGTAAVGAQEMGMVQTATVTYSEWNAAPEITVPAEALAAPEGTLPF